RRWQPWCKAAGEQATYCIGEGQSEAVDHDPLRVEIRAQFHFETLWWNSQFRPGQSIEHCEPGFRPQFHESLVLGVDALDFRGQLIHLARRLWVEKFPGCSHRTAVARVFG